MDWLLLTAFSVVARAIYGVMSKVLSNKVKTSAYTQAMLLPLASALIAIIISPVFGGLKLDFAGVSLVSIALVVLGQGLGNITYFAAMKNLTNSTAQITFSSILVFNTVLSLFFLNLHLSFINLLGLILLALAILSVTTGKVELHKKGVAMMLLSALLFSVFQLASAKISKQVGPIMYLLIAYLGAGAVIFILKSKVIVNDLRHHPDLKPVITFPIIAAIPSLGNFIFAYYAYRNAPQPAKVAILLTSQVVLAVFLSYFFLRERNHLGKKVGASALVVLAAVLIKD